MKDLILKNKKKNKADEPVKNTIMVKQQQPGTRSEHSRNEQDDGVDPEVFDLLKSEEETGSLNEARRYFENDRAKVRESRFTEENTLMEEGFEDWFF
ncbi:hypothetical protein HDF26_005231 [Pedobacter cryoconitis]|uniref:Uncharacterized protein n=1 Tax=Pedobacter cryoconitis TaxID=188932 RepID=A0A7W8ZMP0_9SPHI|nr:hypothetical protein [Pedobacter cryoconitis]MBB5636755.1 hypothetical protein [Pedobacter cryoconitis]MBB6274749.1 hypothetical protein [Pedobacter cryoconitis]